MQTLKLADPYQLSYGGGARQATTKKACPVGYYYVPATGNCWPKTTTLNDSIEDNYLTVPTSDGGTVKVREDYFDNLPEAQYVAIMDVLEPYNTAQVSGLFSKWRKNKAQKKDERNARKIAKIDARAVGRVATAQAGGGIGNALKGIAGSIFGKNESEAPEDSRGFSLDVNSEPTTKKWYSNPAIMIPVGIAAIGGVYLLTRSKKKK